MLPSDEYDRIRVAFIMGFASWAAFHERLSHWRARIDWHFRQVIADPDEDESGEAACGSVGAEWIPRVGGGAGRGVGQPATGRRRLRRCRGGLEASQRSAPRPQVRAMQRLGRERLDAFVPRLLAMTVENPSRTWCWSGFCRWWKRWRGVPGVADREPRRAGAPADPARPARWLPSRSRDSRSCSTSCSTRGACSVLHRPPSWPPSCANG